jgi:Putative abortive phage resistance protein AbiGi, antitoxin
MMKDEVEIRELLNHRTDLSSFIVHFTRKTTGGSPRANLRRILRKKVLEARNPFGPASEFVTRKDRHSQKCVSFSEVPLAFVHCLIRRIPNRQISLSPYGLAFRKMQAREKGANPVWYVDITPGHEFLMNSINRMIEKQVEDETFSTSDTAKICPFIEQMGTGVRSRDGQRYQKEFWWEREWRHVGDFHFFYSDVVLGFAPEEEVEDFEELMHKPNRRSIRFVDPCWSAERMIAHLTQTKGNLSPFDSED